MATPDIRVRLTPEGVDEVIRGLRAINKEAQTTGKGIGAAFGGLRNLIPAIGFTAVSAGLLAIGKSALNAADQVGKLQQRVGGTVENLSALSFAANLNNVSNEELEKSLVRLNRSIGELLKGTEAQKEAFADLGLAGSDLAGLDTTQAFEKIAKAAADMGAGLDRTNALVGIFGKDAAKLIPLLNDVGTKGFGAVREEAERLGLIVSSELANAAATINDNFTLMEKRSQGLATQFLVGFAPAVTAAFDQFQKDTQDKGTKSMVEFGEKSGRVLRLFIDTLNFAVNLAGNVFGTLGRAIGGILAALDSGGFKQAGQILSETFSTLKDDVVKTAQETSKDFRRIIDNAGKDAPKLEIKPTVDTKAVKETAAQAATAGKAAREVLQNLNKEISDDQIKSLKEQATRRQKAIEDQIQQQRALVEAQSAKGGDTTGTAQRLANIDRQLAQSRIQLQRDAFQSELQLVTAREVALRTAAQKQLGDTKNNERVQVEITRQTNKQRTDIAVAYYGELVKLQQQFTAQYKTAQQNIAAIDKEILDNRKEGETLFGDLKLAQLTEQQQFGIRIRTANDKLEELQSAVLRGNVDRAREIRKEIVSLSGDIAKATKVDPNAIAIGEKIFNEANEAMQGLLEQKKQIEVQNAATAQKGIEETTTQIAKVQEGITKLQKEAGAIKVNVDDQSLQTMIDKIRKALNDSPFQIAVQAQINTQGGQQIQAFAGGGIVGGHAPSPRADNALALVTPGEAITQVPAVRYYGIDFMNRLNKMQLPRFADGGIVGGAPGGNDADSMGSLDISINGKDIGPVQGSRDTLRNLAYAIKSAQRGT